MLMNIIVGILVFCSTVTSLCFGTEETWTVTARKVPFPASSATFNFTEGNRPIGQAVRTRQLLPSYHYDFYDREGELQVQGITRVISLGLLFSWGVDIDLYDSDSRYIGKIEGQFWTESKAKFLFYGSDGYPRGVAYFDGEDPYLRIVIPDEESDVLAELTGSAIGSKNLWTVKITYPLSKVEESLLKIFSAFVADYSAQFEVANNTVEEFVEDTPITFKDVAGCDEAKEELEEIVEFLKDPEKFTELGARIPRGVLCCGPPGTGKTLLAKAVAGEAGCKFISVSGAAVSGIFVGLGSVRIQELFRQAKKHAPAIIFIDEIDAIGSQRGSSGGSVSDDKDQTLNQLLVEMDGFDSRQGVILIGATNRPEILDSALLRSGRFDRQIYINLPDVKGRMEILQVHARKIKLDPSVQLLSIAKKTPGCSGADLENILNEAALLAARGRRNAVTTQDVEEACDKVRYGKQRKSLEVDEHERLATAYHESGHTVVALLVKHADLVDKVTIIPRGSSLGATHFMPKKNRLGYWKKELIDQLAVAMGGRAAEEVFFGDISSGAQSDLLQATQLARSMVCEWGMTDALGAVAYDVPSMSHPYFGKQEKNYSEETAKFIDNEVRNLLDEAYKQALEIIKTHRAEVQLMTDLLMEFETLDRNDVLDIINGKWDSAKKIESLKTAAELQKKPAALRQI